MEDRDKAEVRCNGCCQCCPAPHTGHADLNFPHSVINSLWIPLTQGLSTPSILAKFQPDNQIVSKVLVYFWSFNWINIYTFSSGQSQMLLSAFQYLLTVHSAVDSCCSRSNQFYPVLVLRLLTIIHRFLSTETVQLKRAKDFILLQNQIIKHLLINFFPSMFINNYEIALSSNLAAN